jgi:hypothetical protein
MDFITNLSDSDASDSDASDSDASGMQCRCASASASDTTTVTPAPLFNKAESDVGDATSIVISEVIADLVGGVVDAAAADGTTNTDDTTDDVAAYDQYCAERAALLSNIKLAYDALQSKQHKEVMKMSRLRGAVGDDDDDDNDASDHNVDDRNTSHDGNYKPKPLKPKRRASNVNVSVNKSTINPWINGANNLQKWLTDAGKNQRTIAAIIKHLGEFLTFCLAFFKAANDGPSFQTSILLMLHVINHKRSLFSQYRTDLETHALQPATVKKRLLALLPAIGFLQVIQDDGHSSDFGGATSTVQTIVKNISCQVSTSQVTKNDLTTLIRDGRYPKEGLSQLRTYVDAGSSYFDALVTAARKGINLKGNQYCFCLSYILCMCWVYRNNAR